ncbi:uncharacterized protein [Temnothorax nylanderi]|uniref:uncharacterized protein n=1 Tax=Temnothorax nylanderi TaxID=102681 RepID=UPI003A892C8A
MVVLFVDLKAAFDSVDKGLLVEAMRKRGVREGLVKRCKELLEETVYRVRVEEKLGEKFWTGRLLADIDDELRREGWGGNRLRGRKLYTLTYAADIAMLAESEEDMKGMVGKLEEYLDRRGLVLNSGKTKEAGRTRKREGKERSGVTRTCMGDWKEEVWGRLEQETMVI